MKSIKVVAFIIGAIALFPSMSHAQNISDNQQIVDTVTINNGNGTINDTTIRQENIVQQKASRHGLNVSKNGQAVIRHTENNGHGTINVSNIEQLNGVRQKPGAYKFK
jgi:hypothetical protein